MDPLASQNRISSLTCLPLNRSLSSDSELSASRSESSSSSLPEQPQKPFIRPKKLSSISITSKSESNSPPIPDAADSTVMSVLDSLEDSQFEFEESNLPNNVLETLNEQRRDGRLCDVTLDIDGKEILAHKSVLAMRSDYFCSMFTYGFKESKEEKVTIHGVEGDIASILIEYLYTGRVTITAANVEALVKGASMFLIKPVLVACAQYLTSQLNAKTCLGLLHFGDMYDLNEVVKEAEAFLKKNFDEIYEQPQFQCIEATKLADILDDKDLEVSSPEVLFEAVRTWINHDSDNRKCYLAEFLKKVQLTRMSTYYLANDVACEQLIKSDDECKDFVMEVLRLKLMERSLLMSKGDGDGCRLDLDFVLLAIGGRRSGVNLTSVEVFSSQSKVWCQLSSLPEGRSGLGACAINNLVYVLGGYTGHKSWFGAVGYVDVFDPATNSWEQVGSLPTSRSGFGIAVIDHLIYIIGGVNEDHSCYLRDSHCYDTCERTWEALPPMKFSRGMCSAAAMKRRVFAIGGCANGASAMATVECFDSLQSTWQMAAPMTQKRRQFSVANLNGSMYAVGGYDGSKVLKKVESFSWKTGMWRRVADMLTCRRSPGVIGHEGLLYVVGGWSGTEFLNSCEIYVPVLNTWTILGTRLQVAREELQLIRVELKTSENAEDC